jgi:methyl-accepting chemotaxis protein
MGVALLIVIAEVIRSIGDADAQARARQEMALRGAALTLDHALDGFEVSTRPDGALRRVSWREAPAFADHSLIDSIGAVSGETATIFVRGGDGDFWRRTTNIVKPDGTRAVGTPLGKQGAVFPAVDAGRTFHGQATILGTDYLTIYQPIFGPGGAVEGILYVGVTEANVAAVWLKVAATVAGVALVAVLAAAPLAFTLVGRALSGLNGFRADMARLSGGDVDSLVSGQEREDEIGEIARGLDALRASLATAAAERQAAARAREEMLDSVQAGVGTVVTAATQGDFSARVETRFDAPQIVALAEGVNRICQTTQAFLDDVEATVGPMADGDLSHRAGRDHQGGFGRVAGRLNEALDHLIDLIAGVQSSVGEGRAALGRLETGVDAIAGRSETQAASLEQTAAAMTEMSGNVTTNAGAIDEAAAAAREVSSSSAEGAAAVAKTVDAVNRIKESAGQITQIIGMIEGIAFQTNLLALNASIEAARAGDAGKGFAVVAAEVRALAQRAAESSREINGLVSTSNTHVEDGICRVGEAGDALSAIEAATARLDERLESLAAAGREQATGVAEITVAVGQMDKMTQEAAAETERFASELRGLGSQIGAIAEAAAAFATSNTDQPRAGIASTARMSA